MSRNATQATKPRCTCFLSSVGGGGGGGGPKTLESRHAGAKGRLRESQAILQAMERLPRLLDPCCKGLRKWTISYWPRIQDPKTAQGAIAEEPWQEAASLCIGFRSGVWGLGVSFGRGLLWCVHAKSQMLINLLPSLVEVATFICELVLQCVVSSRRWGALFSATV